VVSVHGPGVGVVEGEGRGVGWVGQVWGGAGGGVCGGCAVAWCYGAGWCVGTQNTRTVRSSRSNENEPRDMLSGAWRCHVPAVLLVRRAQGGSKQQSGRL